jgi:antitoxin HicB
MVSYYARFKPEPKVGGFSISFPDIPGALTQSESIEEGMAMALDVLRCSFRWFIEEGKDVSLPGKAKPGRGLHLITLSVMDSAKVELYRAWMASGIKKAELARRLKIGRANVDRLFDLDNHSRMDQIEAAFRALGKRVEITVLAA